MSQVLRSDSFLLEAYMRRAARNMGVKLLDPYANMNTPHEHPVLLQWGSNSVVIDRDDLAPLIDLMEDDETTPNSFLRDGLVPFLRKHADKK